MPIKSFRGLIADNGIDTISLHTNTGSTGYRIVKFQVFPREFGGAAAEHTVQIFTVPQESAAATVDFSDQTLLGAAAINNNASAHNYPLEFVSVFDNMTFNQDIYITHVDNLGANAVNYYIELEMVKLDLNENTVATLKDIRNIKSQ
jgi:hypothetical protein